MFRIACPWCGPREQVEFRCGGEAGIVRPADPAAADDAAFAAYLYQRANARGRQAELWLHAHGCRRWFTLLRDTGSDAVLAAWPVGEAPPDAPAT